MLSAVVVVSWLSAGLVVDWFVLQLGVSKSCASSRALSSRSGRLWLPPSDDEIAAVGEIRRESEIDLSQIHNYIKQLQQLGPNGPAHAQPEGLSQAERDARRGLLRVKQLFGWILVALTLCVSAVFESFCCEISAVALVSGQQGTPDTCGLRNFTQHSPSSRFTPSLLGRGTES